MFLRDVSVFEMPNKEIGFQGFNESKWGFESIYRLRSYLLYIFVRKKMSYAVLFNSSENLCLKLLTESVTTRNRNHTPSVFKLQ